MMGGINLGVYEQNGETQERNRMKMLMGMYTWGKCAFEMLVFRQFDLRKQQFHMVRLNKKALKANYSPRKESISQICLRLAIGQT